ncbi:migration and invasion enhancer 1-like [Acanthaster planci]|uniref:Migration and invasion enhancer 1-like n=1 Tax=Acanthaster planci TaxID=133434 RepID=A0A8B8A4B0_ACAPL|nr:migration and invasion enhancer 1-like [Acanthaster planci]XP_022110755.1 migration and invasion enhancer 1-like [Acanthaster planci]XP_022110756.1 migration and invasion enhancer 1-like [Acanthaster planci]
MDLKIDIQSADPEVAVDGSVGRRTSFEITLNGQLLYSKLEVGRFPVHAEIVDAIMKYSGEGDIKAANGGPKNKSKSECVVL